MTRSYFTPGVRWAGITTGVAILALGTIVVAAPGGGPASPAEWFYAVMAIWAAVGLFILRAAFSGIYVRNGGVLVRNPLRSWWLEWSELAEFGVSSAGPFEPIALVRSSDGRVLRVFGLQAGGFFFGSDEAGLNAKMAMLSAELARREGLTVSGTSKPTGTQRTG